MKTLKFGSRSNQVKYLQLLLKNIGTYTGNVDGIFGNNTKNAVVAFQEKTSLDTTGIVDVSIWNALVPYAIVPTDIPYSYDIMLLNLQRFRLKYTFLDFGNIGTSVMGKEIPYIQIGYGKNKVIYVASTHANEWITSPVLMKFIQDFCDAYLKEESIYNIPTKKIYELSSIYIVPMLNPDGVDLVTKDIDTHSNEYIYAKNIAQNYPSIPFPDGWKANIQGIDLNLQFPAKWEEAKEIKYSNGYTSPAPRDFVGNFPLEAPEALAIYDFIHSNSFSLMLTYHTQGAVIYPNFLNYSPKYSSEYANIFSKVSGYSVETTPFSSSFAGLKDWYIQTYNKPGYTIEAGIGVNPLPISQFNKIYSDNIGILVYGALPYNEIPTDAKI